MESVIKQLIDIDKEAQQIVVKNEKRINEYEKNIKNNLDEVKKKIIGKAQKKAETIMKTYEAEAVSESENIRTLSREECMSIENKYQKIKGNLRKTIFEQIINYEIKNEGSM